LPERLRSEYRLPFGSLERHVFRRSLSAIQSVYPRLPLRARSVPAHAAAQRRLSLR
jgi:uncharacterized protein (DUF2236 family)